jgi:anti-anti-sigma factor
MDRPYQHIDVKRNGDVFCVRLRRHRLNEVELPEMCGELTHLVQSAECKKMVLSLGPPDLECLYSIFLARLVNLQRRLQEAGGALRLAHASAETLRIFDVCRLVQLFRFMPDEDAAVRDLQTRA